MISFIYTRCFEWYSKKCSDAKLRLKNLARLLQKYPKDPSIRGQYCLVKKEYRKTVRTARNTFEIETIKTLQSKADHPKEFWSFLKSLGKKPLSSATSPSSDEWVEYFSSLYTGNHSVQSPMDETVSTVVNFVEQELQPEPVRPSNMTDNIMYPFEVEETISGIKQLKSGKAVASDQISNDMLKATVEITAPVITEIFNRIVKSECFPKIWSLGLIIPLFKSGDINDVNNYRGITINSCLSKLLMLLLNSRLQKFCEEKGIIHYNQIGFIPSSRPCFHFQNNGGSSFCRKEATVYLFCGF